MPTGPEGPPDRAFDEEEDEEDEEDEEEEEDEEDDDDEPMTKGAKLKAFLKSTKARVGGIALAVAAAAGGVVAASQKGCLPSFSGPEASQSFCISQRAVPVAGGAEGETQLEYRIVATKWEKHVPVGSKKERRGDDTVYTTPDGTKLVFRAAAVDWDDTAAQVDSTGGACAKPQVQELVKE